MYSAPHGGTQSDSRDRENAVNNFQDIESFLDSVLVQTPVSLNADLVPAVLSKGLGLNTDSTSFGQQGSNDRKQGSGKPWSSVSNGVPLTQRNTTTNNFNNGSTEAAKQPGARKEDTDGSGRKPDGKKPETVPIGTGSLQPSPQQGNAKSLQRSEHNVGPPGQGKGKEAHPATVKVGEGSMGMKGESFRPDMNAVQPQQHMIHQMYAANMVKPGESGALMGRFEQQAGKADQMVGQARLRGGVPEQQQQQLYPPGMMFSPQQQAAPWGYAPMPYYYPSQSQFQAACMNQAFPYPVAVPPAAMGGQQRRYAFYPGVYQGSPTGEEEEDGDDKAKALKKSRLVWTKELHMSFLAAIERCGGIHKASPKAIMKDMNVDGLTRENVASHLQKYRMRLKKGSSQEQHDLETDDNERKYDQTT